MNIVISNIFYIAAGLIEFVSILLQYPSLLLATTANFIGGLGQKIEGSAEITDENEEGDE